MSILSHFWLFLATCDSFQPLLMTISYHSWLFLTITKHFQTFHPLLTTSIHLCPFQPFSDILGHFWLLVTPSSHLTIDHPARWPFLTIQPDDHFLPLQTIYDQYKAFPANSNHIQPFLAIFNHFRPFWAIFDHLCPLLTTSTHFWWPFLTTNDNFWPFEGPKSRGKPFGRWLLYTAYIVGCIGLRGAIIWHFLGRL